jgi:hypothetical protein
VGVDLASKGPYPLVGESEFVPLNLYSHLQNRLRPLSPEIFVSTDHVIYFRRGRGTVAPCHPMYSEVPGQPRILALDPVMPFAPKLYSDMAFCLCSFL